MNIEIIRDSNDKIYFIEIGARNGGNLMPELAKLATGFDFAVANVQSALNQPFNFSCCYPVGNYFTQYILHTNENGIYSGISIDKQFIENIELKLEYYVEGDSVVRYRDSRSVIGVYLFKFGSLNKCKMFINHIRQGQNVLIK